MATGEGGWPEREVTGGGPTLAKLRAAERSGAARAPLIRTLRLWPLETAPTIPDPPPRLKGRKAGGGPEWSPLPLIRARSSGPSERCAPDSGPPPLV
jgi:hypothetical protein